MLWRVDVVMVSQSCLSLCQVLCVAARRPTSLWHALRNLLTTLSWTGGVANFEVPAHENKVKNRVNYWKHDPGKRTSLRVFMNQRLCSNFFELCQHPVLFSISVFVCTIFFAVRPSICVVMVLCLKNARVEPTSKREASILGVHCVGSHGLVWHAMMFVC